MVCENFTASIVNLRVLEVNVENGFVPIYVITVWLNPNTVTH
jgi:hypothetical protein